MISATSFGGSPTIPTKNTMPLGGGFLKYLNLDIIDSMAERTFFLVCLDFILDDCEYSSLR